ncbi:MAG: hypothetical protein CL912_12870 [Deltaproteobacteria bacterium]|nr:hypothetical protein [Deltaproteobacteria bacterium]|tara:strand:- start:284 stop:544 length:261 start_codon:yes stop_codon:yes gene_type:complete
MDMLGIPSLPDISWPQKHEISAEVNEHIVMERTADQETKLSSINSRRFPGQDPPLVNMRGRQATPQIWKWGMGELGMHTIGKWGCT